MTVFAQLNSRNCINLFFLGWSSYAFILKSKNESEFGCVSERLKTLFVQIKESQQFTPCCLPWPQGAQRRWPRGFVQLKRSVGRHVTMTLRKIWEAGQQPVLEKFLPWWPSAPGGAESLWRPGGSGNARGRSPGSDSTSRPSAGPAAGPAARRCSTWLPCTPPSWPRLLGCPQRCGRRLGPPEEGICEGWDRVTDVD